MPQTVNKILITGATGALGSVLTKKLSQTYNCIPLGNSKLPENGFQLDLTNKNECYSILDQECPDVIIHTVALTDVDRCERELTSAFHLNVQTTRHLVDWVSQHGNKTRFIYISTDQVYNGKEAYSVESDIEPINIYGLTKLWAEDLVRTLDDSLILRTNFYGLGLRSIVNWLQDAAKSGQSLTLFEDVKFNPLYIGHLISIVMDLLTTNIKGTFNLAASGKSMSKADFIESVIERFSLKDVKYVRGVTTDVNFLSAPRPLDMSMSVKYLEKQLGQQFPSISDGINKMHDDWRQLKN